MSVYFEGYGQAKRLVEEMNEQELLDYLDNLWGRDKLRSDYSLDELRQEALRQCEKEFTNTDSPEYERIESWKNIVKAQLGARYR